MEIAAAQTDVQRTYRHGSVGAFIAAAIWFAAATLATISTGPGVFLAELCVLFVGAIAVHPLTAVILSLLGAPARLPRGHPLAPLVVETQLQIIVGGVIGFFVALSVPWYLFPIAMIVYGMSLLSFGFLYGMRMYTVLAAVIAGAGVLVGLVSSQLVVAGAWFTTAAFVAFGLLAVVRQRRANP